MKNILLITDRPIKKDILTPIIKSHPELFMGNYYYDRATIVRHIDDNCLAFEKRKDGSWYTNQTCFQNLILNDFPIPEDTYVLASDVMSYLKQGELSTMDEFICINDSDIDGVLSFVKYLEGNNIPFSKASYMWTNDYTEESLLEALQKPLPFSEVWEQTKTQLLENGFEHTAYGSIEYILK